MAKYFDDSTTCEQHTGLVNLLSDDNEPIPTLSTLGPTADEPATFCVRCRSLSNASSNYPNDVDAGTREWINNLEDDVKCETVGNGYHPPSCGDGADLPLLARTPPVLKEHVAPPINNPIAYAALSKANSSCLAFGGFGRSNSSLVRTPKTPSNDEVAFVGEVRENCFLNASHELGF
ncbi:Protein of unknown function [Gryllus bimaculatus]|nr:Protein of unknown function [Gryllus bimaculatus]